MKKYIIATITLFSFVFFINAQQIDYGRPQITPTSIDAASTMKAVNFPVSNMTGVPDITIPLYEIQVGDITLPISISYHASGLRPKEGSGRVGTGWTLNAEPSVVREIRGNPDDSSNPSKLGWHYIGREDLGYDPGDMQRRLMQGLADNTFDSELDFFTYKLATRGGSFVMPYRDDEYATTYPRSDDKIRARGLYSIYIESPDGLEYELGGTSDYAKEKTSSGFITRWMCTAIRSYKTKAYIGFSYSEGNPSMRRSSIGLNSMITIEDRGIMLGDGQAHLYVMGHPYTLRQRIYYEADLSNFTYKLIYPSSGTSIISQGGTAYYADEPNKNSKLEKIYCGEKRIEFTYHMKDLNGIKNNITNISVIDNKNTLLQTINLYTSPYNYQTELTKLDSIIIKTPNTEIKKYYFRYKDIGSVPSTHTLGIDHWGYANGTNGGSFGGFSHMVPDISTVINFHNSITGRYTPMFVDIKGANREANYEAASAGVLTEITDPEGLKTKFEYEGNYGAYSMEYYGYKKENHRYLYPVGGLRVKKISTEYGPSLHKFREFEYGMIGKKTPSGINDSINIMWGGGAIKHYVSTLDYMFRNYTTKHFGFQNEEGYTVTQYNSTPYSTIAHPDGSAVHYEIVIEKQSDQQYNDYIKNVYYYSVMKHDYDKVLKWNYPYGDNPTLSTIPKEVLRQGDITYNWESPKNLSRYVNVFHYEDGRLLKTEEYQKNKKSSSPKELITSRTVKTYKFFRGLSATLSARKSVKLRNIIFMNPYGYYDKEKLKKEYERYPEGISPQFSTSWYTAWYKWYTLMDEITETYSYNIQEGSEVTPSPIVTKTEYNYLGSYDPIHMNPVAIKRQNSDLSVSVDSMSYYEKYSNILLYHSHEKNKSKKESKILLNDKGRTHKVQTKTNLDKEFFDEVIYHEYDDYGNIAHISGKEGRHTCYIWSYEGQYPIAEINNITYADMLSALNKDRAWIRNLCYSTIPSESDFALINTLRDKLPQSLMSTYTYKPNYGLTSICEPNGSTTYYEHDAERRLKEVYIKEGIEHQTINKYNYSFYSKIKSGNELLKGELYTLDLKMMSPVFPENHIYPSNQKVKFGIRALGGTEQYDVKVQIGLNKDPFVPTDETRLISYYRLYQSKILIEELTVPNTNGIIRIVCTVRDRETNKTATITGCAYASPYGTQPPALSTSN